MDHNIHNMHVHITIRRNKLKLGAYLEFCKRGDPTFLNNQTVKNNYLPLYQVLTTINIV